MDRNERLRALAFLLVLLMATVGDASFLKPRRKPNAAKLCSSPPDVEFAYPQGDPTEPGFPVGTALYYVCEFGLASSGDTSVRCVDDGVAGGKWTEPAFACFPTLCEPPERPDNGRIAGTDFTFGQTITYECYTGHRMWSADGVILLKYAVQRICKADGTWTSEMPQCKPVSCPDHSPKFRNGYVDVSSTTYMSKATYHCHEGYLLNGTRERYCGPDGQWTGEMEPVCEDAPEPAPDQVPQEPDWNYHFGKDFVLPTPTPQPEPGFFQRGINRIKKGWNAFKRFFGLR